MSDNTEIKERIKKLGYAPKLNRSWLIHTIENYRDKNKEYAITTYELELLSTKENLNSLSLDKLVDKYYHELYVLKQFHARIKDIRNKNQSLQDLIINKN